MRLSARLAALVPMVMGGAALVVAPGSAVAAAPAAPASFLGSLPSQTRVASTVPANGDVNPYGVAVVPRSTGRLQRGHVLVSNFNARSNAQGTGTTIVSIAPGGRRSLFAQLPRTLPGRCPGGVGLTTALGVLRSGWVVVGSLPTSDGTAATAKAGCLIVLDSHGRVRETLRGNGINGPWDMTIASGRRQAQLFVSNVLNGTVAGHGAVVRRGTVVRVTLQLRGNRPPRRVATTVVGSRFPERTDPDALVVGPTGLVLGRSGALYVADTASNRLARIPDALTRTHSAGRGMTVRSGGALMAPLGLALAPNGDLLSANAGNGNLVETAPGGRHMSVRTVDRSGMPPGAGALFGLAVPGPHSLLFVDDATNTLQRLR